MNNIDFFPIITQGFPLIVHGSLQFWKPTGQQHTHSIFYSLTYMLPERNTFNTKAHSSWSSSSHRHSVSQPHFLAKGQETL